LSNTVLAIVLFAFVAFQNSWRHRQVLCSKSSRTAGGQWCLTERYTQVPHSLVCP